MPVALFWPSLFLRFFRRRLPPTRRPASIRQALPKQPCPFTPILLFLCSFLASTKFANVFCFFPNRGVSKPFYVTTPSHYPGRAYLTNKPNRPFPPFWPGIAFVFRGRGVFQPSPPQLHKISHYRLLSCLRQTLCCISSHSIEGASFRPAGASHGHPILKALIAAVQSAISFKSSILLAILFLPVGLA